MFHEVSADVGIKTQMHMGELGEFGAQLNVINYYFCANVIV